MTSSLKLRPFFLIVSALACVLGWMWLFQPSDGETPVSTGTPAQTSSKPAPVASLDSPATPATRTLVIVDAPTDAPIVGAVVRWGEQSLRWSNANGELAWQESGSTAVTVGAQGYLPTRVLVAPDTERIALQPGGHTVSGVVRDLYGGVVPGAAVTTGPLAYALTNDEGRYALTVPTGHWRIQAHSDDYFPSATAVQVTEDATIDFDLLPGGAIEGVVEDEHGAPMPNASVDYAILVPRASGYSYTPTSASQSTRTDTSGRFRLAPLRPATYQLLARTASASTPAPLSVRVTLLETRDDVTLVVRAGHAVDGHVFDDQGVPFAGARVLARHQAGNLIETVADENGAYRLLGLHDGPWSFQAAAGEGDLGSNIERVIGREPDPIDLRLARGGQIDGHVTDGSGAHVTLGLPPGPVSFAEVARANAVRALSTIAAEDGAFVFPSVPPGVWIVHARTDDGHTGSSSVELEPAGEAKVRVELQAPGEISGTLDNRGGDSDGVRIRLRQGERKLAATGLDAGGSFAFTRVPAGRWSLDVLHHGAAVPIAEGPAVVDVASAQTEQVHLVVESASHTLRGRVIDVDGAPVSDAYVEVHPGERGERGETRQAVTDADGRFALSSASAATYRVDVTGPDGLGLAVATAVASNADLDVVLHEPASVRGRVLADGLPVRRFQVRPSGLTVLGPFFSDSDGRFVLEDIRPGDFTVSVLAPEGVGHHSLQLQDGEVAEMTLNLEPWAVVRGRVIDTQGSPVPGVSVDVSSEAGRADGSDGAVPTDKEGRFTIEGLGPGPTVVTATKGDATYRTERLDLQPGSVLDVGDLELGLE